jgi:predicted amidohydrolase
MIEEGEDFHIAVFPGAFSLHVGPKLEEPDLEGQSFWGHTSTRTHALEAGCFVLSACGYMQANDLPGGFPLKETVNLDYAHGGSQIVAPLGIPLVGPISGDTIIYADCKADMIKVWKAVIDTVGHYARPDIVRLDYLKLQQRSFSEIAGRTLEKRSDDEFEIIAERHGIDKNQLEAALERSSR